MKKPWLIDKGGKMKKRVDWLDTAKALAIFFVVIGHSLIPNDLRTYIYSFHMPFFFFLSGLFFSPKDSFKDFVISKYDKILKPYFLMAFLSYIFWLFVRNYSDSYSKINILSPIKATFLGSNLGHNALSHNVLLWFLPCLFITSLFFYFVSKLQNKNKILLGLLILSLSGHLVNILSPFRLPWGIDSALIAVMFYGVGHLSKNYVFNKLGTEKNKGTIISLCFIFSIIFCYLNTRMDIKGFELGHSLIYLYLSGFAGIYFWLYLSKFIPYNKIINFIGRNSLIIFLIQYNVFDLINGFSSKILKYPISNNYEKLVEINPSANVIIVSLIYILTPFIVAIILIYLIRTLCSFINKNLIKDKYQIRNDYE